MKIFYGARHELERIIHTHLFIISPNNSGSTFLQKALATSEHTWNLKKEGQHTYGFVGPTPYSINQSLVWAAHKEGIEILSKESAYDWQATRKAWYFQAYSKNYKSTIFIEKSPPSLLRVTQLENIFRNAKFIFMVRNPYAVVEGILRWRKRTGSVSATRAAEHIMQCFYFQQKNIEKFVNNGVFFKYEEMCSKPELIQSKIQVLVPELNDFQLNQKLSVKGRYCETLQDMNARQIECLTKEKLERINSVFTQHKQVMKYFDYAIQEKGV